MEQTRDGLSCVKCPICEEIVTKNIQSHVEKCLEKFKRTESSEPRQDSCVCVVCRADITNLDASQRTAHVNRCLDRECNEPVQEPVVSTPSRSSGASFELLDCPLCERGFKSSKACKVHIKQCSVQLNMSPKQVIDAIRLQQRYMQERLAAGLPLIHRRKPVTDEPILRPAKRTRPAATIPKSKFQEEIQMARALSASMTAKEPGGSRDRGGQRVLGHVNSRSKRVKREEKPTPALLTTTSEDRTRVAESKISRLLASTVADSIEKRLCPFRRSWASLIKPSRRLQELAVEGPSVLWTKAAQCTTGKDQFYVPTLNSTVTTCKVEAGSKLRSLSQVAGHRISDGGADLGHLDEQYASFLESQKPVKKEPGTQDHQAALLSLIGGSLQPCTTSGDVGHGFLTQEQSAKASGSQLEESWESKCLRQLSCDLSKRVGSSRYADLRISVEGGKTIHAHRVVVYARCPSVENDVVKSNGANCLNWSEWSETCARTFLGYLYGGTVDVKFRDKELVLQLRSLAFRYNLNSFCKYLEEKLGDSLDNQSSLDNSLSEIITSLWDEEAVPVDNSEKVEETPTDDDGEVFDDVYEFVASQRPGKSSDSQNIPKGGSISQSQTNLEGSQQDQPSLSQPSREGRTGSEKFLQCQPQLSAASQAECEQVSQLRSSQSKLPQAWMPIESHTNHKGLSQPRSCQPQPQNPAASQVAHRGSPQPEPSQVAQPQQRLLSERHTGRSGSPQPQSSQSWTPAQGHMDCRRTPEPRPNQVPTASQVAYRRSPKPVQSQPQPRLCLEDEADFSHQPRPQQLPSAQTDFERHSKSQPERLPSSHVEGSKHPTDSGSPARHVAPSYPATSVPIAISPIHSEDEHTRVVPSKILSLPLPPMENGQPWYSPSSVHNAPSTAGSSNDPNGSDAESAELFGSCDEVESNPEPQTTGDSDAEQPMEAPDEGSCSPRSVQSVEEQQGPEQGDEDDIWDSVWEGFGDQGHCEVPELALSPIGDSKDSDVTSETREEPQEQFGAEEAGGRSVHSAMLDSHFFDEEQCNEPCQSPAYTRLLTSRERTPVSAVTPLPDYDAMQTPELKAQLQKFGVRAFPRKKAVNMLRHIYDETHPYLNDTPRRPPRHSSSASQPNLSRVRFTASGEHTQSLVAGDDDYAESHSSSSSNGDIGEPDSKAEDDDSDCQSEMDVIDKMREFVKENRQLYQQILSYEPIELRTLHEDMKDARIKVSQKVLMDFLDEQCITFRLPRTEKQRLKQQRRQKRFRQRIRAKIASSRP